MVVQSKCYVVLKINDSMEMMTYEIKLTKKNIYLQGNSVFPPK